LLVLVQQVPHPVVNRIPSGLKPEFFVQVEPPQYSPQNNENRPPERLRWVTDAISTVH